MPKGGYWKKQEAMRGGTIAQSPERAAPAGLSGEKLAVFHGTSSIGKAW